VTSDVGRALAATVRQAPSDWSAWLVYADWLSERGCVRGELVALEHRLATAALSAAERLALERQARALEEAHRAEWLGCWVPPEKARLEWRCGFLTGVWLPWTDDTLAVLAELVAHPVARLLTRLDLSNNGIGDDGLRALAASDSLGCISALDLGSNGIGDDGAHMLAASPSLGSLVRLSLWGNGIGADGARALAAGDSLRSLTVLGLGDNGIGDEGARALAAADSLRSLTRLTLRSNGIGDPGAQALAASRSLRSLAALELGGNDIGPAGAHALATSESLRGCRVSR
jgi:uncharacterized protein (TIGR02996 family)